MSWFDEQIRLRKLNDDELLEATYSSLAGVVLGKGVAWALENEKDQARDAISAVMLYYHIKAGELPEEITDVNEQMEYLMRPHGIMRRTVTLPSGWTKDASGAMLGTRTDDGSIVALLPGNLSGYYFVDSATGKKVRITAANENLIDKEAVAFYKPFPLRKINLADLVLFIKDVIRPVDVAIYLVMMGLVTLVGLLLPALNHFLTEDVIEAGSMQALGAAAFGLICIIISQNIMTAMQNIAMQRVDTKISLAVEAATMMRVLSLPASFFKKFSSGELSSYTGQINSLCSMLVNTVVSTGLSAVFSLVYITQIFHYAPALVIPSFLIILATFLFTVITSFARMKYTKDMMHAQAKESGLSFELISGIQKIKLSGAEKRAFAKWGECYSKSAEFTYSPPWYIRYSGMISSAISLIGTMWIYSVAAESGMSVADYYAFNAAYAMVSAAFMALAGITTSISQIRPILETAKPIMDAEPEISEGKEHVTRVSGSIELSHVSFKYVDNMPNVLDDVSLKIKAGQYVAIVGKTGCGKSTLMRLLLGFEKPQKGAIYYDNRDIEKLDLKSLRRKIGVVMQSGKLFLGDIYSNIVISAPWLTVKDAWEAAEIAGMARDIEDMPMGMNTMIAEGSGGISGGQKQRLMIARAVAPKPRILMLDEATSALDNITQKHVSDALDKLKCTRIVIAHRLSTIRQCDRIIVLDGGHIVEDGNYEQLLAKNGFFAELVKRQMVEEKA